MWTSYTNTFTSNTHIQTKQILKKKYKRQKENNLYWTNTFPQLPNKKNKNKNLECQFLTYQNICLARFIDTHTIFIYFNFDLHPINWVPLWQFYNHAISIFGCIIPIYFLLCNSLQIRISVIWTILYIIIILMILLNIPPFNMDELYPVSLRHQLHRPRGRMNSVQGRKILLNFQCEVFRHWTQDPI